MGNNSKNNNSLFEFLLERLPRSPEEVERRKVIDYVWTDGNRILCGDEGHALFLKSLLENVDREKYIVSWFPPDADNVQDTFAGWWHVTLKKKGSNMMNMNKKMATCILQYLSFKFAEKYGLKIVRTEEEMWNANIASYPENQKGKNLRKIIYADEVKKGYLVKFDFHLSSPGLEISLPDGSFAELRIAFGAGSCWATGKFYGTTGLSLLNELDEEWESAVSYAAMDVDYKENESFPRNLFEAILHLLPASSTEAEEYNNDVSAWSEEGMIYSGNEQFVSHLIPFLEMVDGYRYELDYAGQGRYWLIEQM